MGALRVPKVSARVEITLVDGGTFSATIFLAERAETHPGTERLAEWLSSPSQFLPAMAGQPERVQWLSRDAIRSVRAPAAADPDPIAEATIPTEQELVLHLADDQVVRGLIAYVRPVEHSRVTDILNEVHPFIRLVEGTDVLFINKRHVLRVTMGEE